MATGAMNYIGTISILERAAAPAQAVLDRTARSRAQRAAEETKEELSKVMNRVENIYGNFELDNIIFENKYSGMEYVEDMEKLEEILRDQVKKKKYQQQITIFVVGFQKDSEQKLRLLKQVNEFFMENTKKMEEEEEEEDTPSKSPEQDLGSAQDTIEDTLRTTEELMQRLGDVHQEVVNYMYNYIQARTNNKGKKKMEKALTQSKDDINHLNEKLLNLQKEIEDRDDKIQQFAKQAELRHVEITRYRTAADAAKKSNQDVDKLQEEVRRRDEIIRELQGHIGQLQIDLGQVENSNQMANSRVTDAQQEGNMKVEQLQKALEDKNIEMEEAKRRLQRQSDNRMEGAKESHKRELEKMRRQHEEELRKLTEDLETARDRIESAEKAKRALAIAELQRDSMSRQAAEAAKHAIELQKVIAKTSSESQRLPPVTPTVDDLGQGEESQASQRYLEDDKGKKDKKTKKSLAKGKDGATKKDAKVPASKKPDSRKSQNKQTKKQGQKEGEFADAAVQDDDESPDRNLSRDLGAAPMDPVPDSATKEFQDEFGLDDETQWASVPPEDVYGRFAQYRSMARDVITDLSDQLETTVRKTTRKIDTIKGQFQEHKTRWEEEKAILMKQISDAQQLQQAAEEEATLAMAQMEGYIAQEDILDEEEETKTKVLLETDEGAAANENEERPTSHKSVATAAAAAESHVTSDAEINPESEAEMQKKLLDMTDDAKVLSRQKSRGSSAEESTATANKSTSSTPLPKKRSVTFSASLPKKSDWLGPEQRIIVDSLTKMLASEEEFTDAQQKALEIMKTELSEEGNRSGPLLVYCLACHLAHEGVLMGIDPTSLLTTIGHLTALSFAEADKMTFVMPETPLFSLKDLRRLKSYGLARQISESDLRESIKGETVEELKVSSANSRRSLRDHQRTSLQALKAESSGRQSRSSGSTQSPKSSVKLDQEDEDLSISEDTAVFLGTDQVRTDYQDVATSPFQQQMEVSAASGYHPAVEEFLKTYEGVSNFKETLVQIFMDKEMTSASEELEELQQMSFNKEGEIGVQLEQLTSSTNLILATCAKLVDSLLDANRESYNVSVMETTTVPTKMVTEPEPVRPTSKSEREVSDSLRRELQAQLQDLQAQYLTLQRQFDENTKQYEGQTQRKTKTMIEMQDTIQTLRQEVAELKMEVAEKPAEPVNLTDTPLMFTRMDSERNAKILKRAVNERRISHDKYAEAVKTMDSYTSLPAKRFAHLVRKYVHHSNLKNIGKNLRKSRYANSSHVVGTIDKMEAFESARAEKWAETMDAMGSERFELASSLMTTLDDIEQESGIFLIKPFYSYKGTAASKKYQGKLSRRPPLREKALVTSATHVRTIHQLQYQVRPSSSRGGLAGKASHIEALQNLPVWMPGASQTTDDIFSSGVEIPKIMELDVNRMLIPQNQISMKVVPSAVTDDRLTNAANASVRSYIAVNRPTRLPQQPLYQTTNQPETREVKTPPMTREASFAQTHKGYSSAERPPSLPSTPPLPPIVTPSVHIAAEKAYEVPLPPASPPGSSIRQTPQDIHTRPSTRHSAKFSQLSETSEQ